MASSKQPSIGIVLSGGGARGAYEVGVLSGIVDVLGLGPDDPAPFNIFSGASVGAINAAWLAGHADRGDMHIDGLADCWRSLSLGTHLRLAPTGLLRSRGRVPRLPWRKKLTNEASRFGPSLIDPEPLENLVEDNVPWDRLHANVDSGLVKALVITATDIASGNTTMFAELSSEANFRPSPERHAVRARITSDHVLASAAIPMVFPARRIGDTPFCDGGVRFNTPIAPAIRNGADRVVVIPLLSGVRFLGDNTEAYSSPLFLLGKVLAALLLDPVERDLQVMGRFNTLFSMLEETLPPEAMAKVQDAIQAERGAPYHRVDAIAFRPSKDIGVTAHEFIDQSRLKGRASRLTELALRLAARSFGSVEADLFSFMLFDGNFADKLIAMGRQDVHQRADEVVSFFRSGARPALKVAGSTGR